ncbi:MAG: NADH-quinone oxidoreductase subunit J [Ilumatobacteraceae bacterium]|jgi:NADH-quinone oxidoreductase subunit J|nr:NADH-quinone oxidoreductase subunit J [Ilumatobacteraceae bacterium]
MELIVFVLASAMMLIGAFGVITRRNPVHAALSLVLTLFGVAVHFVALEAYFLAAVQIIVYAGAIVVLFLFVIMLLGVDKAEDLQTEPLVAQRWLAGIAGLGLLGLLVIAVSRGAEMLTTRAEGLATSAEGASGDANIQQLARSVFGDYVVAFELTSILLVVAVVGTVMLARRRVPGEA